MHKIARKGHYFHVIFDSDIKKWKIKEVGNSEIKTIDNKIDAINEAKKMSSSSMFGHIVVHNEKGKFESL